MTQPICRSCFDPDLIFVFGANGGGEHWAGAAGHAYIAHGAEWGCGNGPTGQSYAINTMSGYDTIKNQVGEFLTYAKSHPDKRFFVTAIGCGIAGYTKDQIAPLFAASPANCILPEGWN